MSGSWLLAACFVAGACASGSELVDEAPSVAVAGSTSAPTTTERPARTTTAPTSTDSVAETTAAAPVSTPTSSTPATAPTTAADAEPAFPAPALPTLQRFTFDAPAGSPMGYDDELLLWHGTSEVARVDVDTGEITTASIVAGDRLRSETFYTVTTDEAYVMVADVVGQGTLDAIVVVDPDTLEIIADAEFAGASPVGFASGPAPRTVAARSEAVAAAFAAHPHLGIVATNGVDRSTIWNRGEYWEWNDDRIDVIDADGTPLASVAVDVNVAGFGFSTPGPITANEFWVVESSGRLMRIDRPTYTVTHDIDLRDHFDWATAIRTRAGNPDTNFLVVNVSTDDEGWWMLVGIDPASGEVVSEHVIATDSFEYGWNSFEAPFVATVGDRVFVRDHRRSVVEVDVAALADGTGQAWVDPDIAVASVLDAAEREVAEATLRFLDPDDDSVASTDPAAASAAMDVLVPASEAQGASDWVIYSAEVVGDRGWSRAGPVGEAAGVFFVFARLDGVWHVDADGLCALAFQRRCSAT